MTDAFFDWGIIFYPEAPTNIKRVNQEQKLFFDPVKTPSAPQVTINIIVFSMKMITLLSFWVSTFYGTYIQKLLCHSAKPLLGSLRPIIVLKHQLTYLKQDVGNVQR